MSWLGEMLGKEPEVKHGGACGVYLERIRRRELDLDHAPREFESEELDDEGSQFDYELGKDAARDTLNCELFWCWQRFEREARERKWTQTQRNRHLSEFSRHLRKQLGTATIEPSYVNARRNYEGSRGTPR